MKKTLKKLLFLAMGLLVAVNMCSCGDGNENRKSDDEDKIVIGMVIDGLVIERWQRIGTYCFKARELGASDRSQCQ